MLNRMPSAVRNLVIALALSTGSSNGVHADTVTEFYRGKSLTIIVGSPAGTAYDLYARTISRHLPRHVPGAPTPVLQNMPGAGSLVAANYIANVAPRDGTVIGAINSAVPFQKLFGVTAVRFEPTRVNWLPSPAGFSAVIVVSREAPAQTFAELRRTEVLIATLSPGATPSFYTAVFNDLFGTKLKAITGHASMPAALLAMQRGEVHGFPSTPWPSLVRSYGDLYRSGQITILLQYGPERIPELKDTPFAADLVTNADDRRLLDISMAPLILGYPYMMADGVNPERVAAIRRAMISVMTDPAFLEEAKKQSLDIRPVSGEDAQRIIQAAYDAPTGVVERIRRIYENQSK
jgi:tripartite-type tricarboxylate transporter receptor subunit TctC